jgi:hypothetical protein
MIAMALATLAVVSSAPEPAQQSRTEARYAARAVADTIAPAFTEQHLRAAPYRVTGCTRLNGAQFRCWLTMRGDYQTCRVRTRSTVSAAWLEVVVRRIRCVDRRR